MPDEGDISQELEAHALAVALENVKHSTISLSPRGKCHNCDEQVVNPQLFCDHLCRDDYDRRQAAAKRNGR
jgi:hypothetical protein